MDQIEFYDRYKQYSTADLINVVREKDNYQVAAVLAAEQVLREREVSSGDQAEADRDFGEKEAKRMAATARVDSYKAAVADRAEPLARPSAELQPYKWYRIFLVVYGFWYARDLYYVIRYFIAASKFGLSIEDFLLNGVDLAWGLDGSALTPRYRYTWPFFISRLSFSYGGRRWPNSLE